VNLSVLGGWIVTVKELFKIFISLILIMGLVTGTLVILNAVPPLIYKDQAIQTFTTIEEVEYKLGIKLHLPAYFPDYISWPPAKTQFKQKPYGLVSLSFHDRGNRDLVMTIHQIFAEHNPSLPRLFRVKSVDQEIPIKLNTQAAIFTSFVKDDGHKWNCVWWKESDRQVIIAARFADTELLKIAKSMIHER
jgi:hypothetical protein